MKHLLFFIAFIPIFSLAQIYTEANAHTNFNTVSAQWSPGTIITNEGDELEGDVRGFSYKGNDIKSFRYRAQKGATVDTYKADACKQVIYDGLNIISLPKNFKKPEGNKRFYIAIYYGKHFSVLQDPKVSVVNAGPGSMIMNQGQMLNFLGLKNNELHKISKLWFKKQIKNLLSDNPQWVSKTKDKKWFKYSNIYEVADFYNDTFE